jgi:lipoate-protein ligase A
MASDSPISEAPVTWRLIPLLDAPGAVQMAIDWWLLQHQRYGHPPTLRFYTWNPPAISLGVSQHRHFPDHWHNLRWQGQPIDLVRRPSGGRGVLHQGDLTYAVVTSHLPGNLDRVYRTICQFLITGWQTLGVDLQFGQPDRQYVRSQNCFGLATNADLIDTHGNKFIGSAQRKQGSYVLQHGTMVLDPDFDLFQRVFQTPPPPPISLQEGRLTDLSPPTIITALTQAAQHCFNCNLIEQPLTQTEWTEIRALAHQHPDLPRLPEANEDSTSTGLPLPSNPAP